MSSLLLTGAGPSGAGSAFTPASIPGLTAWFDASAITGLNDNDPVSTWTDSSPSAFTAVQGTAGNKPIYKTGIINGKPVVRFDGVDDYLSVAGVDANPTDFAFFAVASTTTITGQHTLSGGDVLTNRHYQLRSSVATLSLFDRQVSGSVGTGRTLVVNTPYVMGFEMQTVSGAFTLATNGAYTTGTNARAARTPGNATRIGGDTAASEWWSGDIAELIYVQTTISAGDRDLVETYLGTKYGITVA